MKLPDQPDDRPPYSNRGVIPGPDTENIGEIEHAFDAYCATVYAHPWPLLDHLEQALMDAGMNPSRSAGPPVRFYSENTLLLDPDGHRLLSVRAWGQNHHPFVECKGIASPVVAAVLREHFNHVPARLDVAVDRSGPDLMQHLNALALQFERERGVLLERAGADIDNVDRGSTIYLGSRKSQSFLRVYQKGLQIAAEMNMRPEDIPDELRNWVRIEVELKPDKRPARQRASTLDPHEVFGCSPWIRDFAKLALSIDAKRVTMNERRETNHERRMRYLTQQYGPTILEQVNRLGSWEAFAEDLQARLGVGLQEAA